MLFRAIVAVSLAAVAVQAEVRLNGKVTSETGKPVSGARIKLLYLPTNAAHLSTSDPTGAFTLAVPAPGPYEAEIDREGFFLLHSKRIQLSEGVTEAQFVLSSVREVVTSVDVDANPGAVDMDRTNKQTVLNSNDLLDVPFAANNTLRNALRVTPGMVQDGRGGIHLSGGTEEQTLYTLEGFQINDPLTGRFESRLSVEGVQSVETTEARPRAEFGKGAAGVLALRSRSGDDKFRYSATNFMPGVEFPKGFLIGNWTPRGNLSGPLRKGRAWFSDSMDLQYINTVIQELPRGEDRTPSWRGSNLLHTQFNLTPSNILTVGSLINIYQATRAGLSALDPKDTTVDRRSRQFFTYIKDQMYLSRGALLEFGYADNRTFTRAIPQGSEALILTPYGRRGNNFLDAEQHGGRNQVLANVFLPAFHSRGEHRLKTGIDLDRITYRQNMRRSGITYVNEELAPLRITEYRGSGELRRNNFEASTYVQDDWRVRPNVLIEIGARSDWDSILSNWTLSPRVGFAWSPRDLWKVYGGYARIIDPTNIRMFTRPWDQYIVTTLLDPDGTITHGPAFSIYEIFPSRLATPQFHNWNLGLENQLPYRIQSRISFTGRRGRNGFEYDNGLLSSRIERPEVFGGVRSPTFDAIYQLRSQRADHYNALEITLRQPIRQRYEWMVSYIRSRARSSSVVERTIDDPIVVDNNSGRLPWDTPNRWLSWGYLPTPFQKWSVAYLAEYRTGFPYFLQDSAGRVVGSVDQNRFPAFFELNLFLERRVGFRKHWWAVRAGFHNITNHRNPNVVNNMVGSPEFGHLYGGQSRAFNLRVRWLGKQ
ncbi:MAG: TonB-dependent receptor [Acidobacteria bacterium]|nr:TonB-dependent receptor [Acidobacteriota bacterium]